jgi:hypothetical protein
MDMKRRRGIKRGVLANYLAAGALAIMAAIYLFFGHYGDALVWTFLAVAFLSAGMTQNPNRQNSVWWPRLMYAGTLMAAATFISQIIRDRM